MLLVYFRWFGCVFLFKVDHPDIRVSQAFSTGIFFLVICWFMVSIAAD